MPIYEYECGECGRISEFIENITTEKPNVICSHCGSNRLSRILSRGFIPKGGTFSEEVSGKTCCEREERCERPRVPLTENAGNDFMGDET